MSTVVVLAAGAGTRLQPYTDVLPKALFPVGDKPCIRWITDDVQDQGFNDVILCVNKQDEDIFRYEYRDSDVEFSVSDKPLGTSGEIYNADRNLYLDWPLLVIYADDLTYTNYNLMFNTHNIAKSNGFIGTLGVTGNNRLEVGVMKANNGHIEEFYEKPEISRFGWISWTGRAIFEQDVIPYLKKGEDIASDVFPKALDKLYTYKSDHEWLDIGNVQHYLRANKLAKEKGSVW